MVCFATRLPPGVTPVPAERVTEIVRLTRTPPPHEVTHWTLRDGEGRRNGGLNSAGPLEIAWPQPHRWWQFRLSGPAFVEKRTDIVGLYVAALAHALVLRVDEKSQIQVLDRTRRGLPLKKGRGASLTRDDKRNGTSTLFAALNILDGTVIGQNMQRRWYQKFIRFLSRIERDIPVGKAIPAIADNYAAHKHEKVRAWLKRHPRQTIHVTPTSSTWLNAVEGFFAKLKRRRLKYGVVHSVIDPHTAINRFIVQYNDNDAKPFQWTADQDKIIAARKPWAPNFGINRLDSQ